MGLVPQSKSNLHRRIRPAIHHLTFRRQDTLAKSDHRRGKIAALVVRKCNWVKRKRPKERRNFPRRQIDLAGERKRASLQSTSTNKLYISIDFKYKQKRPQMLEKKSTVTSCLWADCGLLRLPPNRTCREGLQWSKGHVHQFPRSFALCRLKGVILLSCFGRT